MNLTYKFAEMTPEKRPQDPSLDGTGLIFETLEHGGEAANRFAVFHQIPRFMPVALRGPTSASGQNENTRTDRPRHRSPI
jgi:hypothetical protein